MGEKGWSPDVSGLGSNMVNRILSLYVSCNSFVVKVGLFGNWSLDIPNYHLPTAFSARWSHGCIKDMEDSKMLGPAELHEVCAPDCPVERRRRLQHALVGKFAYFRSIGRTTGRQWSQVVLGQDRVSEAVQG